MNRGGVTGSHAPSARFSQVQDEGNTGNSGNIGNTRNMSKSAVIYILI